jgi:hypothetical protein
LRHYYYTIAALETIRLEEKVPISEARFLQFAEDTLNAKDYQVLLKSRWGLTEPTGLPFADRILSWEKELRLELGKARILKLQFDPLPVLPASDGQDSLVEKVRAALALDSPLDAERFLDHLRWSFLEGMGACHFFDLEALVVYYFKLQIALRQEKFQKELGQESFEKAYASVTESFNITTL